MPHLEPDTILTVCVIAEEKDIAAAREGSCRFIRSETNNRTRDTPEMMLPVMLNPTGESPPTHLLCTRKMTPVEFQRQDDAIRAYPVPVVAQIVESEEAFLASRNLKKIHG
jgi:hypothetical protein